MAQKRKNRLYRWNVYNSWRPLTTITDLANIKIECRPMADAKTRRLFQSNHIHNHVRWCLHAFKIRFSLASKPDTPISWGRISNQRNWKALTGRDFDSFSSTKGVIITQRLLYSAATHFISNPAVCLTCSTERNACRGGHIVAWLFLLLIKRYELKGEWGGAKIHRRKWL